MPKIRDLGINTIPSTTRRFDLAHATPRSPEMPPCPGASGPPNPPPGPDCEKSNQPRGGGKYFSAQAVVQLRQQLDQAIANSSMT
jgi:hypothetical protein